jgi:hypothetical protein
MERPDIATSHRSGCKSPLRIVPIRDRESQAKAIAITGSCASP